MWGVTRIAVGWLCWSGLLITAVQAGEEMVQCADKPGSDPVIFRKGECQPLDDPTVPPGFAAKPAAKSPAGVDGQQSPSPEGDAQSTAELEQLKKEFDQVKKQLTEIKDVGRYEINTSKGEEVESLGTPGPWRVSQTLVPAAGERSSVFDKSAVINGYRYRVGERADGGVVKEISRDRVVMVHDGKETVVPFDKTTHASIFGRVGSVPLTRMESGIYLVKVRVNNNQEIQAVLDTGASHLVLPEDVVAWLMRSGTLKPEDFLSEGQAIMADGSQIDTRLFKIHSLRVGDMELKEVEGVEVPTKKADKKSEKSKSKNKTTKEATDQDKKSSESDSSEKKPQDVAELTQPLFGINGLRMLGKWRIDHINNQLIVER